jgi:hypothetical protein
MFLVEFGDPHLHVSEPRMMPSRTPGLPSQVARRRVAVKGSWTLLVEYCDWRLTLHGVLLADSDSAHEQIDQALRLLAGQALTALDVDRVTGEASFVFDLGAELRAWPAPSGTYGDEPSVQWTLFRPDGDCLVLRDDLRYAIHRSDDAGASEDDSHWQPLASR